MTETITKKYTYTMENKDEYTFYKEKDKWLLFLFDTDHPQGKFLLRHKDIEKIYERMPS